MKWCEYDIIALSIIKYIAIPDNT